MKLFSGPTHTHHRRACPGSRAGPCRVERGDLVCPAGSSGCGPESSGNGESDGSLEPDLTWACPSDPDPERASRQPLKHS